MEQVLEPTLTQDIAELRSVLNGTVFLPGDPGFDEATTGWNLLIRNQPAAVVVAKSESDVQAAVRFAKRVNLTIAVQATGHGQFKTCHGALLINLAALDSVDINVASQSAKIGGGTQWGKVIESAEALDLIPISGSSPGVGVVGYTLGGGYGLLSRKYGLGVDQVLSMRLVDSRGDIQNVSPTENEEVFWAMLGGGGAFGVVTEIEVKLHPHPQILGGTVMFDASRADAVAQAYLNFTKSCPEEVTSALTQMTFPPVPFIPEFLHGRSMLIFGATALGDLEEAQKMLAPMRDLPGAEFDAFRPMRYTDTPAVFNDPVDPLPATVRGVMLRDLDEDTISSAFRAVGPPAQSENLVFCIRHYGGAATRGGQHATSVGSQRQAQYLLYFLGVPMGPVTIEAMHAQAERVFAAVEPQVLARGPINFLGEGDVSAKDVLDTFSPEDGAKQLRIKKAFDPENIFRFAGVGLN